MEFKTKLLEEKPKRRSQFEAAYFLIEHKLVEPFRLPNGADVPKVTSAGQEQFEAIVFSIYKRMKAHPKLNFQIPERIALQGLAEAVLEGTGGALETLVHYYSGTLMQDLRETLVDLNESWIKNQ